MMSLMPLDLHAGVSSPQASNNLAGPAVLSGTYPPQGGSFTNRPLITSGSGYSTSKAFGHVQNPATGSQPTAATTATTPGIDATSSRSQSMGPPTAGPAAAATAAALATAQQRYSALQATAMFSGAAKQGFSNPSHIGTLPGQAAAYGRAPGPQTGAIPPSPAGQSALGQAVRQSAMQYIPQSSQPYSAAQSQALYSAHAQPSYAFQQSPYAAQLQAAAELQTQRQSTSSAAYGSQPQLSYTASTALQSPYQLQQQLQHQLPYQQHPYTTAAQPYAVAAPQPAPRRPPLTVEHLTFSKLAAQPKNAIDLISEDAVLPTFPLKKKKPKKRKYAGLEAFAAEVYRHKELAREARRNVLQCQMVKKGPLGRPPKVCFHTV